MANNPKKLSQKELVEIETMAGLGMRFEDIAKLKGMSDDTLRKYAQEYLERGKAKAKVSVMQTAYKMATSGKFPTMTKYWLQTQCGWQENMPDTNKAQEFSADRIDLFLAEILMQVKVGQLNPRIGSVVASLANTLMKAIEQYKLEERLSAMESIVNTPIVQGDSLLRQDFNFDEAGFEFASDAEEEKEEDS